MKLLDYTQGNILSLYWIQEDSLYLYEIPFYGSSRLGVIKENKLLKVKTAQNTTGIMSLPIPVNIAQSKNTTKPSVYTIGKKHYETTDRLGNVRVTYTDKKSWNNGMFALNVSSFQDYYPFGSVMEGRKYNLTAYRYAFNTQERLPELNESHYTALYWEYDGRLARRWNVDPKFSPFESAYAVFGDNPVYFIDWNGDFKLSKRIQKKYPNLTKILKNIEKTTKNDIRTWNAFKQTLGLTDEQASEILKWGEGPKVKIKNLGNLFGNNLAYFGITKNKRNIIINKQLINSLEGKEKSVTINKDEIVFAIYVTLLHEAQHHAEFKYGITKFDPYNEIDPNHEAGLSFELNAFKGIGVFNKHEQSNNSIKTFREILSSKNKFEIKSLYYTNKEQKGRKFQIIFSNYNILENLNVK